MSQGKIAFAFCDYANIQFIDDKTEDVWSLPCTTPSSIGIDGKEDIRTDLRLSFSIRNKFTIEIPGNLEGYFSRVKIGLGSKHVYPPKGYMKEHYDTRLPDLEPNFPHIMTMVVSKDNNSLFVNGKIIKAKNNSYYSNYFTVFSIDCPHKVENGDYQRHSFTFPIYGEFLPGASLETVDSENIYDKLLDILVELLENSDGKKIKKINEETISVLQGYLRPVQDERIEQLIFRLRKDKGYYNTENLFESNGYIEKSYVKISYTQGDYKTEEIVSEKFQIPENAKNITIEPLPGDERILTELKNILIELQDKYLDEFNSINSQGMVVKFSIPEQPFALLLHGRYYQDSTIKNLSVLDNNIFEYLKAKGRNIRFIPSISETKGISLYKFDIMTNRLVSVDQDLDISGVWGNVSEYTVEFNDNADYDPRYKVVYGIFVVL